MENQKSLFLEDSFCTSSFLKDLDEIENKLNLRNRSLTQNSHTDIKLENKALKNHNKKISQEFLKLKKRKQDAPSETTLKRIKSDTLNVSIDSQPFTSSLTNVNQNKKKSIEEFANMGTDVLGEDSLSSQEKLQMSSWGLPENVLKNYEKSGITSMFPWQVECLMVDGVLEGTNLVYSAPTSAGKTLVAEILLLKKILENGGKGIFILPFVSVAQEKTKHLRSLLKGTNIRVEGFMGSQTPPGGLKATNVAVCTIEKANNIINRLLEDGKLSEISVIVVDELHMVRDNHRGYLLELLLTKLRYIGLKSQESPQIIGMSATLPNLTVLSKWLNAKLYSTTFRPIPLLQMVKIGTTIFDSNFSKIRDLVPQMGVKGDTDGLVQLCIETLLDGFSVLVFCPSKAWCEKIALLIASCLFSIGKPGSCYPDIMVNGIRDRLNGQSLSQLIEALMKTPAGLDPVLAKSIAFGVAFHHAGLTMEERDILEGGFRSGDLPVLVATSTLSSGVNLPARRVIIRSPNFAGSVLDILTYQQMVGRAGRKGKDSQGESILMCGTNEKYKAQILLQSQLPPIQSCLLQHSSLSASMKRAVLEIVVSGAATSAEDIRKYCECTLLAATMAEDTSSATDFNQVIQQCLDYLRDKEFISLDVCEDRTTLKGTKLGKAVLSSGLSPDEGLNVFSELHKARRNFVLENELHVVYQVTPIYVSDSWPNLDWLTFLEIWEKLPQDMRRVGELVGVQEWFIVRAMKGSVNSKVEVMRQRSAIHQRFFAALALHDLVHEMPLQDVIFKYGATKGLLQALQRSAATFAGMVAVFTHELGWRNLELLIEQYQDRLQFGIQRELCDLVRLSLINGQKARVLYNAGIETLSHIANSNHRQIEDIFIASSPFLKAEEGSHYFWASDGTPINLRIAVITLIEEARDLISKDMGISNINWNHDAKIKDTPNTENRKPDRNPIKKKVFQKSKFVKRKSKARFLFSNNVHENSQQVNLLDESTEDSRILRSQRLKKSKSNVPLNSTKNKICLKNGKPGSLLSNVDGEKVTKKSKKHNDSCTSSSATTETEDLNILTASSQSLLSNNHEFKTSLGDNTSESPKPQKRQPNSDSLKSNRNEFKAPVHENNLKCPLISGNSSEDGKSGNICIDTTIKNKKLPENLEGQKHQPCSLLEKHISKWSAKSSVFSDNTIKSSVKGEKYENLSLCSTIEEKNILENLEECKQQSYSDSLFDKQEISNLSVKTPLTDRHSCFESPEIDFLDSSSTMKAQNSTCSEDLFESQSSEVYPVYTESLELAFNLTSSEVTGDLITKEEDIVTETGIMSLTRDSIEQDLKTFEELVSSKILADSLTDTYLEKVFDSFDQTHIRKKSILKNSRQDESSFMLTPNTAAIVDGIFKDIKPPKKDTSDSVDSVEPVCYPEFLNLNHIKITMTTSIQNEFEAFVEEWQRQNEFTMVFATEKMARKPQNSGIGFRVCGRRARRPTVENVTTGLVIENESSLLVGIAISWEHSIIHYISLRSSKFENLTDRSASQVIGEDLPIEKRVQIIKNVFQKGGQKKIYTNDARTTLLLSVRSGLGFIEGTVCDPKVAFWLLNPTEKMPDLWTMAMKYCKINKGTSPKHKLIHAIASRECAVVKHLMRTLSLQLNAIDLLEVYETMEAPNVKVLVIMELNGMGFNNSICEEQKRLIQDKLDLLETEAHILAGQSFSLTSPKDVARIVYDELQLGRGKTPVKGKPTDKDSLEKLRDEHEIPGIIIEYRRLHSAITKTVLPLQQCRVPNACSLDRIHPVSFSFTATGRVTLQDPSLQMIPKDFDITIPKSEATKLKASHSQLGFISSILSPKPTKDFTVSLRHAFSAKPQYVLLSADYKQIELRVLAHLSADEKLLSLLNDGEDPFTIIASQINHVSPGSVSTKQRDQAKQICYGTIYGMGDRTLSRQLGSEEEASAFIESFREVFPHVHSYLQKIVEDACHIGYVQTIKGRRRYLPDIKSRNSHLRSSCERQAINTTIQGSAADLVKMAAVGIENALTESFPSASYVIGLNHPRHCETKSNCGAHFVLQLHDELIYEVANDDLIQVAQLVKHQMENVIPLSVTLSVKLKVGQTWGTMQTLTL